MIWHYVQESTDGSFFVFVCGNRADSKNNIIPLQGLFHCLFSQFGSSDDPVKIN